MTQVSLRSICFLALSFALAAAFAAGCEEEACNGHDGPECVPHEEEGGGGATSTGDGGAGGEGGEGGATAQEGEAG